MQKKEDPIEFLKRADKKLASVINKVKLPKITLVRDYFLQLVKEIINQQLSDKASATITKRFLAIFPKNKCTPEEILLLANQQIRNSGVSFAKVSYIKDLAKKILDKTLNFDDIHKLDDMEVIARLTRVKGIGTWTAEMFLMFTLGRNDVFSYGDQGLKNAMKKLYKLKNHPTPKQAEKISVKWKPYRTWACRFLWASLDLTK